MERMNKLIRNFLEKLRQKRKEKRSLQILRAKYPRSIMTEAYDPEFLACLEDTQK
jgi:hypothetical protein